jgi:hypothetical protein
MFQLKINADEQVLQIKMFDDELEVNAFLKTIPESQIKGIKYFPVSDPGDDYFERFMVIYVK